jgi:phosphoribosylaminoimidazole-succinocarboxamide synthase
MGDEQVGACIRKGKVKEVYEIPGTDELEFRFTDQISVFDKIIPTLIEGKGESLNRTAAYWFERVVEMGFRTHFISDVGPDKMRVKRIEIVDPSELTAESTNVLIPLEFICRHYLAGSLNDRVQKGSVDLGRLGFPPGHFPTYGEQLPKPMVEVTTKLEEVDRPLSFEEAKDLAKLTDQEFQSIVDEVLQIDEVMGKEVGERGLIHVDGKKEFAFDGDRNIMLIDTFGTADEDRFWDASQYVEGKTIELSKEKVRQFYRESGYHESLMQARETGMDEPPIPPLPKDFSEEVSKLYGNLFERITGQPFR